MSNSRWKRHREGRSLADDAFDIDRTSVELHQLLHQSQADTGPFLGTRLGALDSVKALKETRQLLCRDADTGIPYRQPHAAFVVGYMNRHLDLAVEGVLDG